MESNDWIDAERQVERAAELFEQRRWQEAVEQLRSATAINPYNASWFFNLGMTLDQLSRHEEAVTAYGRALEIEPDDAPTLLRLASNLQLLGRLREAIATYEKIQATDVARESAYCGRILCYAELGEHEAAEQMFYQARLYKEHCPTCYYNIAISLADRGQLDKAIYCWEKTLSLDSTFPHAHLRIAEVQWRSGALELSRQHYLEALRQDPGDTHALLDLADLLSELGRDDEAGEKIRRCIESAPEEAAGHAALGRWLIDHERENEAERSLCQAIKLDPTQPGAHLELARLLSHRGELAEARRQLRAELLLRPSDPRILMDLANLFVDLGETRPAVACLKCLVGIDPGNAAGWQNWRQSSSCVAAMTRAWRRPARLSAFSRKMLKPLTIWLWRLVRFMRLTTRSSLSMWPSSNLASRRCWSGSNFTFGINSSAVRRLFGCRACLFCRGENQREPLRFLLMAYVLQPSHRLTLDSR